MIRYKRPIRYKRHDRPLGITKPVRYNRYFVISGIRYNQRISIHVKKDFCHDQLLCFVISGIRYIRLRYKRPRLYFSQKKISVINNFLSSFFQLHGFWINGILPKSWCGQNYGERERATDCECGVLWNSLNLEPRTEGSSVSWSHHCCFL